MSDLGFRIWIWGLGFCVLETSLVSQVAISPTYQHAKNTGHGPCAVKTHFAGQHPRPGRICIIYIYIYMHTCVCMLCYLCCVMLCYVMLCYVMLVMLCDVM